MQIMEKKNQILFAIFCTLWFIKGNIWADFWSVLPELIRCYEVNFELHFFMSIMSYKSPEVVILENILKKLKKISNFSEKVGIFVQKYSFAFFANNSIFLAYLQIIKSANNCQV